VTVATLNASAPTYSNGRLYISNLEPGQVQALDGASGKVVWRHPLPGRTESSPLVVGNAVIAGCECGSVYALNADTGKELWSTAVGGAVKASPAYDDGVVFVGDYSGEMTALDASNGRVRWQASAGNSIYGTAAVAFGRVFAGDLGGGFHAWNEATGSPDWSTSTSGYVYSGATAAKTPDTPPSVYFGSYDGTVYALNARTGSQRWSRYAAGPVSGAGSLIGDVFYAGDLKTTETYGFPGHGRQARVPVPRRRLQPGDLGRPAALHDRLPGDLLAAPRPRPGRPRIRQEEPEPWPASGYSDSPAASKACSRDSNRRNRTTLESSRYQRAKKSRSLLIPLLLPVPAWRKTHRTESPASKYSRYSIS